MMPEPFHSLHLSHSLNPYGGASVACMRLAMALAGRGQRVTVASHDPPDGGPAEDVRGIEFVVLRGSTGQMAQSLSPHVAASDVVHLHGVWDRLLRIGSRLAVQTTKPYVLTPHGMLSDWPMSQKPWRKRVYLKTLGRQLLHHAAVVHLTAEQERTQAKTRLDHDRTAVIPLINDLSHYLDGTPQPCNLPGLPAEGERLLFLSRLNPKKGLDRAIAALAHMERGKLIVAGGDDPVYRQTLLQLAQKLGVENRIVWLGEVEESQKQSLYASADVFVLPTHQENYGQVLVEAMATGTTVVTTRNVDIWQELEQGGAVICSNEPKELAGVLTGLLNDPADRASRGAKGVTFLKDWLSPDTMVSDYIDFYRSLIGRHKG